MTQEMAAAQAAADAASQASAPVPESAGSHAVRHQSLYPSEPAQVTREEGLMLYRDMQLGRRPTLPAVQALYHSSALPLPSTAGLDDLGGISNGLIGACLMAFTRHKRLVLRPDDIFFPLLDAAATHVFQNGEASRNVFVAHEGQKVRVLRYMFA